MNWHALLYIAIILILGWFLYRYLRANPSALSAENLSKSFWTLGMLALILIGFIGLLIVMLRG